jgi:hypothetical protein
VVGAKQDVVGFQLSADAQSFFKVREHVALAAAPLEQQLPVQSLPLLQVAVGSSDQVPSQAVSLVASVQVAFFQQQDPISIRPDGACCFVKHSIGKNTEDTWLLLTNEETGDRWTYEKNKKTTTFSILQLLLFVPALTSTDIVAVALRLVTFCAPNTAVPVMLKSPTTVVLTLKRISSLRARRLMLHASRVVELAPFLKSQLPTAAAASTRTAAENKL